MKTNEILPLLDKLVDNANIFTVRNAERFVTNTQFADAFENLLKDTPEMLCKIAEYALLNFTSHCLEFKLAFAVSVQITVRYKVEVVTSNKRIVPAIQFKCEVSWPSCGAMDLSTTAANINLFQQAAALAQRIEALGTIRLEA